MSQTHSFRVRAFGCHIRVETTCVEAYAILERYVLPSLQRTVGNADPPDVLARVIRVGHQFQLSVGDVEVATANSVVSLMPELTRRVDEAVIQRLTTLRAVHAGVVVWGGRALLLPGASHAGKSSLVAELVRRGATYFSDEYALIDAEGRVHPYPRPLLLRNGSPAQHAVLAEECNGSIGDTPAPVGWILSLQYLREGNWSVAPITQGEALLNLLRNTPHVLAETPDMVWIFQRAVAGASCYAGHRPDVADAVSRIFQLMGSAA